MPVEPDTVRRGWKFSVTAWLPREPTRCPFTVSTMPPGLPIFIETWWVKLHERDEPAGTMPCHFSTPFAA